MKTEREIRAHLADLRVSLAVPCGCSKGDAAAHRECVKGGLAMEANISILAWVLGDHPDYDRMVETVSAFAAQHRAAPHA
jgi:hypothetical protein